MVYSDRYLTLSSRSIKSLWDISPKISCCISFKTSAYNSVSEHYSLSVEHLGFSILYFLNVQISVYVSSSMVFRNSLKRQSKIERRNVIFLSFSKLQCAMIIIYLVLKNVKKKNILKYFGRKMLKIHK